MKLINKNLSEFMELNIDKSIICFGAGKLFQDMFITMDNCFLDKIQCVVDSNLKDEKINCNGYWIQRINFGNISNINFKNCVFLITTMYCYEMILKLENIFADYDVDCYIYPIMSMLVNNKRSDLISPVRKDIIPKTIHYCWFGGNDIPEKNKKCIDSWKKICPDYEILQWNESNYDVKKNKYMYEAYKHGKWGFVPDYARLDILYKYGGIYLDTDVEMLNRPDMLMKYDGFMGFQRNYWINLGLGFGAKKNNKLIGELRDEYDEISFVDENGKLNMIASPYYQTVHLKKYALKCNNEVQNINGNIILPTDWLDPQGYSGGSVKLTKNTISIHHYDESWVSNKDLNNSKYSQIENIIKDYAIFDKN